MRKPLFFIVSLSIVLSTVNSVSAALPQPESSIPSLEHYRSNDPCFDQVKGYLCEIKGFVLENSYLKEEPPVKQTNGKQMEVYLW